MASSRKNFYLARESSRHGGIDMQTNWMKPPNELILEFDQVDIWRISLDLEPESVQWAESSLSVDESQRAARFHFDADRYRFLVSHACLRVVLSRYLDCKPDQVFFTVGEYGKPTLSSNLDLDFNLSHSGDYALISVACNHKVGIDVEHFRPDLEINKVARRFFSEEENSELDGLSPEQQTRGFFNCWTRKEAYIKGHGLGLSLPLESFDVSLTPNQPAILRATRPDATIATRWTLLSLDVDHQYAGAVAVEGRDLDFRFWNWNIIR
jgi:4'-phosphopantetheinyl transferase